MMANLYYDEIGKLHKEDGPAIVYDNGDKCWYIHGVRHRVDGPAIEWVNGQAAWYWYGTPIKCNSQKEFESMLKLKAFW